MERLSSDGSRTTHGVQYMLEAVGVAPEDELLYRDLLREGTASTSDLARNAGRTKSDVERSLRRLQSQGLVSKALGKRVRFIATPPAQALEVLFLQREDELRRARSSAERLIEEARLLRPPEVSTELVEVVIGREAIGQRFIQLQRSAEREVLIFDKPPYATGGSQNDNEIELLERGIRYRVLYDAEALEYPGQLDQLVEIIETGEEARVAGRLPMRLAIADHNLGLIPLALTGPGVEEGDILIRPSPLLEALVMLFETLWERASPIRLKPSGGVEVVPEAATSVSADDQKLLFLLAADVKEVVIGRQLGLSRRTVQRRIRDLMDRFGAHSRLQLVLEAARRSIV